MASRELGWREKTRWGPAGVVSQKPRLGPGGWDTHSYVVEQLRATPKPIAYCNASYRSLEWIFEDMIERGVVMTSVNVWWARDRDDNPRLDNHYYAFFTILTDAIIFHTYAEEQKARIESENARLFFKYMENGMDSQTIEIR